MIFFGKPSHKICIGGIKAAKSVSAPEAFANKIVGPLHLAFDPGRIGGGDFGFKTIMQCKTHQGVVKFVFTRDFADINVFHPVVEDLFGNTAKIFKGTDMTIQKASQISALDELGVHFARIAQYHRE